ncbi:DNA modification methylase [Bradyrhizobium diazoefficiens]
MPQLAKTVYFQDYPRSTTGRSGLTVPFPEPLHDTYEQVSHLSSYTIRDLIGYERFVDLERDAAQKSVSTATFLRDLLLKRLKLTGPAEPQDFRHALQATFQGGKGSPLHEWYPYLEGYSPDFVNSIIDNYAPKAETILDPFCGSGTTALIAALRGRKGFYAEVNPMCRFVIEAKLAALRLPRQQLESIASELEAYADRIEEKLSKSKPNANLKSAFGSAFGSVDFFDAETYQLVLQTRTWLDSIAAKNAELGRFALVAVLRSLVPGSLLVRRGDLRFKTEAELKRAPPQFIKEFRQSLRRVASDLHDVPSAEGTSRLVCSDARTLSQNLSQPIDAIVTSPPYLNGTNYFRNTKIELWFMRELATKGDLRALRDAAITSGINDVTVRKSNDTSLFELSPRLESVLEQFAGNTYDQRIPMMVKAYFAEMATVLKNFREVVSDSGTIAIDLGDSCYGSVWVPTDTILAEMLEANGFRQLDRVTLRERQSRDGRKLSQTLQVFRRSKKKSSVSTPTSSKRVAQNLANWKLFKNELKHQSGEMAKRNWGHPLHSLCSYQGKLKPAIARTLIEAVAPGSGGAILDPFAGVGTIPFEARLMGHTAFAFDISPAAVAISKAKLESVSRSKTATVLKEIGEICRKAKPAKQHATQFANIRFNGPLSEYFHPQTYAEILAVRDYFSNIQTTDGSTALVLSALLHVLHGNRPYALSRRSHPITPFAPTGPFEYRSLHGRLEQKVSKSLDSLESQTLQKGHAYFQDATTQWPKQVRDLDCIITSPPFFDSTRFHTANWMRLWFVGWDHDDFKSKPHSFIDERQKASFEVYDAIFRQGAERLKPHGLFLVHLGKSAKCDMATALETVASRHLDVLDVFDESVAHCESHGIRDKGTVTHHQYLLLRRR